MSCISINTSPVNTSSINADVQHFEGDEFTILERIDIQKSCVEMCERVMNRHVDELSRWEKHFFNMVVPDQADYFIDAVKSDRENSETGEFDFDMLVRVMKAQGQLDFESFSKEKAEDVNAIISYINDNINSIKNVKTQLDEYKEKEEHVIKKWKEIENNNHH